MFLLDQEGNLKIRWNLVLYARLDNRIFRVNSFSGIIVSLKLEVCEKQKHILSILLNYKEDYGWMRWPEKEE